MPATRHLVEWNEAHTGEKNPEKPKEKHKFHTGKGCAELNTDRFEDPEKVCTATRPSRRFGSARPLPSTAADSLRGRADRTPPCRWPPTTGWVDSIWRCT